VGDSARDHRTGRKLPRHYYTPGPIRNVEGVTRSIRDERHDTLTGSAEALISAGVLTAEMLPAPGKCGISWRPSNRQPERGGSWFWVPGYVEVKRRPDGTFHVLLAVSDEEQAIRQAKEEAETEERRRRYAEKLNQGTENINQVNWASEEERQRRERRAAISARDLRAECAKNIDEIRGYVAGAIREQMPVEFTESGRDRIERILADLEAAVAGAQIVAKRHSGGGKGHLRVAWSAS
jgi:hypothetical protein